MDYIFYLFGNWLRVIRIILPKYNITTFLKEIINAVLPTLKEKMYETTSFSVFARREQRSLVILSFSFVCQLHSTLWFACGKIAHPSVMKKLRKRIVYCNLMPRTARFYSVAIKRIRNRSASYSYCAN